MTCHFSICPMPSDSFSQGIRTPPCGMPLPLNNISYGRKVWPSDKTMQNFDFSILLGVDERLILLRKYIHLPFSVFLEGNFLFLLFLKKYNHLCSFSNIDHRRYLAVKRPKQKRRPFDHFTNIFIKNHSERHNVDCNYSQPLYFVRG